MDLRTVCNYLPGETLLPSTSQEMLSNNADEDSESDIETDDEDAEEEVRSSDSDSSTGDSVNCPICLLKFKGQAIGFPEVCGHPFCLDCILEWSKNVQTCPNDRRKFENILVRLDLEGEVVKKIPVSAPGKGEEDDGTPDITECQICRLGNREDVLLLCDRCDQGYHMDCLDPPIDEVPIEDWFCPQCLGTQPLSAAARRRAPLALRVRRTIQRSRQRILRDSSVTRRTRKTKTKKRATKRRKTTKTAGNRRKRKTRTKTKSKKSKKLAVPSPRKRLADALGLGEKNSAAAEPGSHFSLFGNPNDLDSIEDEEHDILSVVSRPNNEPKSLIAKLAERRKAGKSIYSFGPVAAVATPAKPAKPAPVTSSGNPDLLGSILASQSQLSSFGKAPDTVSRPKPKSNSSSRVLGAILASQATLSLLDGVNKSSTKDSPCKVQKNLQSTGSQMGKRCAGQENHSGSQAGNSSQASSGSQSTSQPRANGHASTGRASNGACSGGDDGEDPNKNRRKRPEPRDKSDGADEDVDLYSDIESVDEDSEQQALDKVSDTLPVDDKNSEEDDEKGLVIDDSNAEDATDGKTPESRSEPADEAKQETGSEFLKDEKPAVSTAVPCKFQHGGLPTAAAALSYGPKGASRPQPRPRSTSSAGHVMDDAVKASLVSSIASALKESLTSALLAQSQTEALVDQEEDIPLPAPTYSESKTSDSPEPVVPKDPTLELKFEVPVIKREDDIKVTATIKSEAKPSRKRRMEEIFGSDDDEPKNQADQLEQISDCEEGELDESEAEGVSDREPAPSGNRIVRMLTPPPATSDKRRSNKNGDCEEGEIIDKKQAKQKSAKKKKVDEMTVNVDDEILREAGIGGERRVEMCIEDEGIPSTFKKLDSGKTRHYRHQGDIKVIEGKGDVKLKKEQDADEKQRSKRHEMKRYDVRRVVEQRSRSESKSRSAKKSKSHRKRSSSSSSSASSSSSSSSLSSLSPERSRKDRHNQKRSRSSSSGRHGKRKSKARDRSDDKHRDKKKKAKKKKKVKIKHKERKITADGNERSGHNEADPDGDDIEIPSKAVFASGDKIVVSLHFGSSGTSKPPPPKKSKKRKSGSRERPSKKSKEEEHSSKKSSSKAVKTESKEVKSEPAKETPKTERSSPEPKAEIAKSEAKAKSSDQRRNGEKSESPSKRSESGDSRGVARPRHPRQLHPRHRGKPVLIDIETSCEIPLEESRPSDVIVLSDSDTEAHMAMLDSASIPLPPTPPPPLPSELPPDPAKPEPPKLPELKAPEPAKNHQPVKQQPTVLPRPLIAPRNRGSRGGLLLKQGASVKFSLSSKANALKKVNNPLFQAAEEDEGEEDTNEQTPPVNATQAASPSRSTKADGSKESETAEEGSPKKSSDSQSKRTSPIFRPSTPPLPASSSYDPSHPTRTPSSGSSTPSLPLSPKPRQTALLPPPTPPALSTFPLPHPGAVLMPPMTSLPPPPLPPPPLMTPSFVRPSGQLLPGVYNTSIPPPAILPTHPTVGPPPSASAKPPSQAPVSTPSKAGRPMTPPSPTSSEGSDIFGPPSASPDSPESDRDEAPQVSSSSKSRAPPASGASGGSSFDSIFPSGNSQKVQPSQRPGASSSSSSSKHHSSSSSRTAAPKDKSSAPSGASSTSMALALAQDGEELPSSAVELQVKEKFLKKLNRQERVVEEVRLALKPYYTTKRISKGDYKEILRKCVPKICHTKSGEINPIKIKEMVKGYVKKFRYLNKKEVVAQ